MGGNMTESVFNSTFEMELRILLLMSAAKKQAFSVDRIVSMDFIVCYAGDFQLPYLNPQGDNKYMFTELASRRERIQTAVKSLVIQGLLDVGMDGGYVFCITDAGSKYIKKLKSDYATQYKAIATDAIKRFKGYSDLQLDRMIDDNAVKSVRGGR
jgi:hypothetical protein